MPFSLSGVCSPSEANNCSNPFEVLTDDSAQSFFEGTIILVVLSIWAASAALN